MEKQIEKLKLQKNAVILAHYYAPDEVQRVADFVGDSFYLAKITHIIVKAIQRRNNK